MATVTLEKAFQMALGHHQAGRLEEAETIYAQILTVQANHADVLHLLGVIAGQTGRNESAVHLITRAVALRPNFAEARHHLGIALKDMGQMDGAIAAFRQAIALKPNYPEAHVNLGALLRDQGQLEEAIATFQRALALNPNSPEAHNNLGNALTDKGELDEAIAACERAIALRPDLPEAYNNLGNIFRRRGRLDEAVGTYLRAIALQPGVPEVHNNLGNALRDNGRLDEGISSFRRAIARRHNYPEAHTNLGNALGDICQLDEAMAAHRQAIVFKPDYAEAHNNLAGALTAAGRFDEAVACYRHALSIKPDDAGMHSNLIYTMNFCPALDPAVIEEEHHRWNRKFENPQAKAHRSHGNDRNPSRRLRIGYVSPDFCEHVVGRNVLPILERHDPMQVEVFLYANAARTDVLSPRFALAADGWRNIMGISDESVADTIRADHIDILVDLSLHMRGNRLPLFARKPAPLQVTWAGYPGTTGLESMDFRITDPWLDPPGASLHHYSEASIRLSHSFWCYDPLTGTPPVNPLPGLSAGHVTFGSLNNYCKVNEGVIGLWSKVLCAVENSRLLLLSKHGAHRQRALAVFRQCGVAADRIDWFTPASRQRYLEAYHQIDIGLDTFPYNGHTTSLDFFWMGVPVITLVGSTVVGRGGLSQAMNLGLPELIAQTPDEYMQRAIGLASDLPRLSGLRQSLRERMLASPLMDAPRFTRDLETAYRRIWADWCALQTAAD